MAFADRKDAGRTLAGELRHLRGQDLVVLGLPRGGVPVAAEVAAALWAPLDVSVVRKLGAPYQPELAMGAIGEDGARVVNEQVVDGTWVTEKQLGEVEQRERIELDRRAREYRGDRPRPALRGRTAVIVDDGIATGATARAACRSARQQGAERVVLAVPVAPREWADRVGSDADELVCPETPENFAAVGQFYRDFDQTTDAEVISCLERAPVREVTVDAGDARLPGRLTLPAEARGVVVFAHGSGSGRHSPRNRFVSDALNQAGFGTLLFDLLTEEEEGDRANVFDTEHLGRRLAAATRWLGDAHPVGYFGASTGAAAALWAAAEPESPVRAVVSRGGRPDLAPAERLAAVTAPTLLIVGGDDSLVRELNRTAQGSLTATSDVAVVPGATHLFEEPGALSEVAGLARDWFLDHLAE